MRSSSSLAAILLAILGTLPGCGGHAAGRGKKIPHLRTITTLYFTASSALGGPPENESQFKAEIQKIKPDMSVLDIRSIDELFVSDRDRRPIIVVYGKDGNQAPQIVAYEQNGANGIRLVGNRSGQVVEADAAQFAKLVPSAKTSPSAN